MPTATFQIERYIRKNQTFPFDWGTVRGQARALENFRRLHFTRNEAGLIDVRPGTYYVGKAEYKAHRKPHIIVQSQEEAEALSAYHCPWACISITSPISRDADLNDAHRVDILRLKFHDATPTSPWLRPGDKLFSVDQGRQVLEFAAKVWPKIDVLVVHCQAGISRSAGTAAALSNIYFGDDGEFVNGGCHGRFRPNKHVYDIIMGLHRQLAREEALQNQAS